MKQESRFLTKSRFKLALECPTKLFYTDKKKEYPNKKLDDKFLEALANGGFQVGELAKYYFPGGVNIDELDYKTALEKTSTLLNEENVIIYEPAFQYRNLFIRADILVKRSKNISVYEVKAKSYDTNSDTLFKNNTVVSKWKPYVYDISFQKYVIEKAIPGFSIDAYLIFANKNSIASVEGLNQRFFLRKNEQGRTNIIVIGEINNETIGNEILARIPVNGIADGILNGPSFQDMPEKAFTEWIHFFADNYEKDLLIETSPTANCKECEFCTTMEEELSGLKSGFKECWKRKLKFTDEDFHKPSILDIWDFRKKDYYLSIGKYFQSDLSRVDLEGKTCKSSNKPGLSRVDRQELQINKSKTGDTTHYIDINGLREEVSTWIFPLHFIDFETCTVAIPFNKGRRPYEQIAFQFSHHVADKNGLIEHKGEWINVQQGKFPNFDFIRELKSQLDTDKGTVFRYAAHENTILNAIYNQLKNSNEIDKEPLCEWIKTISKSTNDSIEHWEGLRNMIDIRELILKYYFHPATNGSNSIKDVLPAILNESNFLKGKYSQAIYGSQIKSLNFKNQIWVEFDDKGKVRNPYKQLPNIFDNIDQIALDNMILDEEMNIQDGGTAMMAYAQMQFSQMKEDERKLIQAALLKYCELDTLAMVMICEALNDWIK
jgi:hypothetical protein